MGKLIKIGNTYYTSLPKHSVEDKGWNEGDTLIPKDHGDSFVITKKKNQNE